MTYKLLVKRTVGTDAFNNVEAAAVSNAGVLTITHTGERIAFTWINSRDWVEAYVEEEDE